MSNLKEVGDWEYEQGHVVGVMPDGTLARFDTVLEYHQELEHISRKEEKHETNNR